MKNKSTSDLENKIKQCVEEITLKKTQTHFMSNEVL